MRVVLIVLGLVLLAVVPAVPASHQPTCPSATPANDCRAHATSLTVRDFEFTRDTRGATREPLEPAPWIGSTVWYTFTAFRDSTAWVDTYDNLVSFAGYELLSDGNLSMVASGDWYTIGMSFGCEAGKTYLVQAGLNYDGDPVEGGYANFHLRGGTCQLAPEAPRTPATPSVARTGARGEVEVAWSAPDDGGAEILGYRVYRGTDTCATTLHTVVGPATTSLIETGLAEGHAYCYAVAAVNAVGEGPRSGVAAAVPLGLPRAPPLVSATGGVGEARVAWLAGNDGGSELEGFRVYAASSPSGPFALLAQTDATARSFVETGLGERVARHYQVTQVTALGESVPSPVASALTHGKPTAPRNVDTGPSLTFGVRLTWDAPEDEGGLALTRYEVWRAEKGEPLAFHRNIAPGVRVYEESVAPLAAYDYAVLARNSLGASPLSSRACGEMLPTPSFIGGC